MSKNNLLLKNAYTSKCLSGFVLFVYFVSFFFIFIAYYPGTMCLDAINQYTQALTGEYENWHPPIMAFVWSKLLYIHNGPQVFVIFTLLMLYSGLWLLYCFYKRQSNFALLFLLVPILPQIMILAGTILKDISMAYALLFSFSCFTYSKISKYPYIFIFLAALTFLYAFLLRSNAVFACMPFIYFLIKDSYVKSRFITGVLSIMISLFIYFFGFCLNSYILKAKTTETHILNTMQIDEIAATSHIVNKNLFAKESPVHTWEVSELPQFQLDKGWSCYSTARFDQKLLNKNWYAVMSEYPLDYLLAKLILFKQFARFPFQDPYAHGPFFTFYKNDYGFVFKPNCASHILKSYCLPKYPIEKFLFIPTFWISIAIIDFCLGLRMSSFEGIKVKALSGSALSYFFSFFIVTPTFDYRFIYWIVLSTIVSCCILCCNKTIKEQ